MIGMNTMMEELKRDEGFRGCAYLCTAGKITFGFGHNIQDNPIPENIAEDILLNDIIQCLDACEKFFPWFYQLSDVRQRVIINMIFNLGAEGVSKFKKMIAAIEKNDFELAAREMEDSKWYTQVGDRAKRLVHMMEFDDVAET
jgi:lysozyme